MVGYCVKDQGKPHFRLIQWNVSQDEIEEGKRKVPLCFKNTIHKAHVYYTHMPNAPPPEDVDIRQVLLSMLKSGIYIPDCAWVVPTAGRGMQFSRLKSIWRSMTAPHLLNAADIDNIFIMEDDINPGRNGWGRYYGASEALKDSTSKVVEHWKHNRLPPDDQVFRKDGTQFVAFEDDEASCVTNPREAARDRDMQNWQSLDDDGIVVMDTVPLSRRDEPLENF
jgi:hypothetical protein